MAPSSGSRFGAVGITVGDLERSVDFYTRVLGMVQLQTVQLDHMDEVIVGFEGSSASAIVLMHYTDGSAPRDHGDAIKLVFYVPDPPALAASIRSEGLEIVREPTPMGSSANMVVGFARDPDGYLVEILQARSRSAAPAE